MNLEKEFKSLNTKNLEVCPRCNRYVKFYEMHNYVLKDGTTPVMRMCFRCLKEKINGSK